MNENDISDNKRFSADFCTSESFIPSIVLCNNIAVSLAIYTSTSSFLSLTVFSSSFKLLRTSAEFWPPCSSTATRSAMVLFCAASYSQLVFRPVATLVILATKSEGSASCETCFSYNLRAASCWTYNPEVGASLINSAIASSIRWSATLIAGIIYILLVETESPIVCIFADKSLSSFMICSMASFYLSAALVITSTSVFSLLAIVARSLLILAISVATS